MRETESFIGLFAGREFKVEVSFGFSLALDMLTAALAQMCQMLSAVLIK